MAGPCGKIGVAALAEAQVTATAAGLASSKKRTIAKKTLGVYARRVHLRELSTLFLDRRFKRGDLTSGIRKIAISGGDPIPSFAVQFDQRLLKKFDIRLQARCATLQLLLGRANFHPTNVLPGNRRERYHDQHSRMKQKLPRSGPTPPWLLRFHWLEIIQ